jgi:hypothetical protein
MHRLESTPPAEAGAKTVAIVQSNYIPWKGYFDLINQVDEFILYDDRQYTKRDWRNRNRIKTPAGVIWLSVPVEVSGRYLQRIDETVVADPVWPARHWRTISQNYAGAPYFGEYRKVFEELYLGALPGRLSLINRRFIEVICGLLGIHTPLSWSNDYAASGDGTERLVQLCLAAGATRYLSGPAARAYIEPALFEAAGIELVYASYAGYPEYPQPHPPFEHSVSVVDLLFSMGPGASDCMLSFQTHETIV